MANKLLQKLSAVLPDWILGFIFVWNWFWAVIGLQSKLRIGKMEYPNFIRLRLHFELVRPSPDLGIIIDGFIQTSSQDLP